MRYYSPSRRDTTRRFASPVPCDTISNAAGVRGVQPSEQEDSVNKPATPLMGGALPASQGTASWNLEPTTSRGGQSTPRMSGALPTSSEAGNWGFRHATEPSCQLTPRVQDAGFDSDNSRVHGEFVGGQPVVDAWDSAPHRRTINREDAVVNSKGSAVSNNLDDTWDECGLSNRKTGKTMQSPTTRRHENNNNNNNDSGVTWSDPVSSEEHPGNWGSWNRSARAHGRGTTAVTSQKPLSAEDDWSRRNQASADGDWCASNQASHVDIPAMSCNEGYDPTPQNFISRHQHQTRIGNPYTQRTHIAPPERKLNSRVNPDNYDGNRAGLDGSRVFYSAILPTVPTLRDIGNHAEYTAWFDMLRSILKYHQLTSVIASDANRPHGHKEGRRWDQNRLRAAIIIKGALSFEVFERVRRNGWRDTENPTETVEKVRETHGAVCPCGHSQGMTLLDF